MSESFDQVELKMEKNRLESLTDGIFAFAMTLLVTSLILPRASIVSETSATALISLIPDFFHYIIAFFILAAFWTAHHIQFSHVKFIDKSFLFLSIVSLFFVTLLPFSTSFIGDYSDDMLTTIVFEFNLMVLGLSFALQWFYASRNFRLISPEFPLERIRYALHRNLVIPFVSFVGILLTLAGFDSTTMIYMLSPLVSYAVEKNYFRKKG
jgi:uncharacterized membrane protein